MAFVKVEKRHVGGGAPGTIEPQVRMGAYLADGKVHRSKSINFRFNYALIEKMKWPFDEKRGTHLVVHEGIDADKGFLQIVPADANEQASRRMTLSEGKQGSAISLVIESFHHYVLNECPVASMIVSHVIDDSALIIECPDWFRYNPASVPQPEPGPVPLAPVQLHPGRGHRRRG